MPPKKRLHKILDSVDNFANLSCNLLFRFNLPKLPLIVPFQSLAKNQNNNYRIHP